jgi:hypothetical protein
MKSRVLKKLVRPRWVALAIGVGMTAAGYGGIRTCDWLNRRFPSGDPKSFFGQFDGLAGSCYRLLATGAVLTGMCCVYIVAAAIV